MALGPDQDRVWGLDTRSQGRAILCPVRGKTKGCGSPFLPSVPGWPEQGVSNLIWLEEKSL